MYYDTLNKKLLTVQENNICLTCQLTTWEACIQETSACIFTISEFDSTVLGYFIPLIKWVHSMPVNGNKINVLCEIGEGCGDRNKYFWWKGKQSLYPFFCSQVEYLCIIYPMHLQGVLFSQDMKLQQLEIQAKSHPRVRVSLSPSIQSASSWPLWWSEDWSSIKWILPPLMHCILMIE